MIGNQIVMFGHAGSRNHGCEAIVRSTIGLFNDRRFTLFSYEPNTDYAYSVDRLCRIIKKEEIQMNRLSPLFWKAYYDLKIKRDYEPLNDLFGVSALKVAQKDDIAFSIGGDNYCYSGARRYMLYRESLEKRGVKTVFWGCSVEPTLIDDKMRNDLSKFNLIVARESITYNALKRINSNIVLAPDPAFTLSIEQGTYPEGLEKKSYIGINVSPLIQRLEQSSEITISNFRELVKYILQTTDRNIALIPHVVWEHNDDRVPLKQLYDEFSDTGRVFMVEDQNCMQLKDIISHSEFFVGARTHATIAAYSTCVPTLVVGYSVKARGIAKDLFGTEDGYVLPVQSLRDKYDLTNAFKQLYDNRENIRKHLTEIMPDYIVGIQKAKEAVEAL